MKGEISRVDRIIEKASQSQINSQPAESIAAGRILTDCKSRPNNGQEAIGIIVTDLDGRLRFIDGPWLELMQGSAHHHAPNWLDVVHIDDRAQIVRGWSSCARSGKPFRGRHRLVSRSGDVFWASIAASLLYDSAGAPSAILGVLTRLGHHAAGARDVAGELQQLEPLLARMPIACIVSGGDFRWTYWNPAAEALFGYSLDQVQGKHPFDLIIPAVERPRFEQEFDRITAGEAISEMTATCISREGRTVVCSWRSSAIHDAAGQFIGALTLCQNITQQIQAEQALRRSERQYRQIVDTAQEGVWLRDANAKTVFVNKRMTEMLGYTAEEMMGRPVQDFMDEEQRAEAARRFARRKSGEFQRYDLKYKHKDGSDVWAIVSASPMYDDEGVFIGAFGMVTDITERKRNEETVWRQAYHDALTGLPNRVLFEDRLRQLLAMSGRQDVSVAVMFIDLNRFKQVNDTLGHELGDKLLQIVAERISNSLRAGDTVARLGGDEFTALLPGIENADAVIAVAQKLLDVLSAPVEIDGHEVYAPGSIGISLYPADGEDAQTLLKHADIAMYQAKENGGGYCLFDASMTANTLEHLALESHLHRALQRGELSLLYQPTIDLASGTVTGVEAYCRWRHPELGEVDPAVFIPIAEDTGMISALGEWVLWEVCRQGAEWLSAGHSARIAVNISPRQLMDRSFALQLRSIIAQTGMQAEMLDVEITEAILVKTAEGGTEALANLRELGVRVTLDRFGAGASSLASLRRFQFDAIKIDRSLIARLSDKVDLAIVQAAIDLARRLDIEIIPVGVEFKEQLETLRGLGCRQVQGHLFSAAVPAGQVQFGTAAVARE